MLSDTSMAAKVLPFYTEWMMMDHCLFGLLRVEGRAIAVSSIKVVSDNGE